MAKINRTMLIGVGGVGSALVGPLAALLASDPDCYGELSDDGVAAKPLLVIVDGDEYEEKNLRNQAILPQDVGARKADVAATHVCQLVRAEAWPRYLSGPMEIASWLTSARKEQAKLQDAGVFGGVACIICAVDNDHARKYVYDALNEVPHVSVLVVDPSNGAGDEAYDVDLVTYLRIYDKDQVIEAWPSPLVKYAQLQKPKGRPAHVGCGEKAVSQPQLRTSNMMAATLAYEAVRRWLDDDGVPEGWHANVRTMTIGQVGVRLPRADEMPVAAGAEAPRKE